MNTTALKPTAKPNASFPKAAKVAKSTQAAPLLPGFEAAPRKLRTLPRTLYFAYGANTNVGAMANRCPLAKPHSSMKLRGHKLVFRGVADVVPAKGSMVEGALWWITPQCERALDSFEGFPTFYGKQYGKVTLDGVEHIVMFYTMVEDGPRSPPYNSYERTLREGYDQFGLPQSQIDAAIAEGPPSRHVFETGTRFTWDDAAAWNA